MRRLAGAVALGAAAVALAGCGEPAIRETLECTLHGDGSSEVVLEVRLPDLPEDASDALSDHLAGRRLEYLEGWDVWAPRFERAGARRETLEWEKEADVLRRMRRTADFADPSGLGAFFADTDLGVTFLPDPRRSELTIVPGTPSRASRDQVDQLAGLLDDWSQSVARYLEQVAELYAYLEARPRRAEPVFRALFEDAPEGLRGDEEERLNRLAETVFEVLDVADRTDEAPETVEQLARLVYDPFPAELSVRIQGEVSTVVGFVELGEGAYQAPPLGLEHALVDLESRWIEPPLLTTYERHERLGERDDLDVARFARQPRRVRALPAPHDIAAAVADAVRPAPEYRLVWRPADEEGNR
jgi:hypothetical protein